MAKMLKCPQCKGGKTVTTIVSEFVNGKFEKRPSYKANCPTCKGAGVISPEELKQFKADIAAWCKCGNPSGESVHYADGEHPEMHKHHSRCKDCGKLTQIG
jgi:hypothetical protein